MKKRKTDGFVILYAIILSSMLLAITLGVLNVSLKEINFSTSGKDTNEAFLATDIGVECALFNDKSGSSSFVAGMSGVVNCLGNPNTPLTVDPVDSTAWSFTLSGLGSGSGCTKIFVDKFNSGSPPLPVTTVSSKGYNTGDSACSGSSALNRVERELWVTYADPACTRCVRSVTIDRTKVVGGDQGNFPVLVGGTYPYLATVANGGKVQNSSGYDVGFYTNSNCSTGKMNWETERYTATTGEVAYWVKVPTVNGSGAGSDTVFYMCYGDSSISTDQSSATAVWNTNYQAVWHLKETTGGTDALKDSTSNARHGTDVNTPTLGATGKIYKAVDFLDPNTNRRVDTKDFMDGATALTLEAWINPKAAKGSRIIYKYDGENLSAPVFGLGYNTTNGIQARGRNTLGSTFDIAGGSAATTNTWSHGAMTYDGSNVRVYLNGSEVTSVAFTGTLESDTAPVRLAANGTDTTIDRYFPGLIDEARVSNTARSAGWLATGYNNQSSPSTFYTVGVEQPVP